MEGGVYVSSTLFKENGHLTKISFEGFKEGSLSDNELILLSEHICECEVCADALVNSFNNEELIDAPLGFEQEILAKINNRKERYNHFVFYSLRVVMAASIALMFVFSNGLNFVVNTKVEALKVNQISLSNINTISLNLNNFSQKIINMEVFNNEKGKK